MLKRVLVWVFAAVLAISLFFNYYQYREIQGNNNKQYNMDKEFRAQIDGLTVYLRYWVDEGKELNNEKYKQDISGKMDLAYMSLSYSTYYRNHIVHDAFYKLQYSIEKLSINEARQVIKLLEEIIRPEDSLMDIDACKKLGDYLQSISK